MSKLNDPLRPHIPLSLCVAVVLFICVYGFLQLCYINEIPHISSKDASNLKNKATFECEIISDPKQGKFNTTVQAKLLPENFQVRLILPSEESVFTYGRRVSVIGRFRALKFSTYNKSAYLTGTAGEVSVRSVVSSRRSSSLMRGYASEVRAAVDARIESIQGSTQGKSLLKALLLGDKSGTDTFSEAFRLSGLSHLMSVSGTHLALVCGFVLALTSKARSSKTTSIFLSILAGIGFGFLTGLQPSTLRALWMFGIVSVVYFFGRRKDSLHALCLTVCVLLSFTPHLAASVGFQLSICAVAGILLFFNLFEAWLKQIFFFLPRFANSALAITFAAQGATIPITVPIFKTLSLVSPVANMIASFLIAIALGFGFAGSVVSFFVEPLGSVLLRFSVFICGSIVTVAERCAYIPWSSIDIKEPRVAFALGLCLISLLILLFMLWPVPKSKSSSLSPKLRLFFQVVFFILTIFFLIWALFPEFSQILITPQVENRALSDGVYVLDVGQGDSTLIRSQGKTSLVDAGPDSAVLKTRLKELGVHKIDMLIFTHTHQDHLAGAKNLGRSFGVKEIVVAAGAEYDKDVKAIARDLSASVRTILEGDVLRTGEFELVCLSPRMSVLDSDANESCLILLADDDESSGPDFENVLITGDAEAITVMQALHKTRKRIEVFKVGHHGSARSVNENLVVIMQPKKAVISVGRNNSYGHPKQGVLELLNRFSIPYLRTDLAGTIFIGAKFGAKSP